jgi:alpha-beta hydrolase superfamily lysophospholipase
VISHGLGEHGACYRHVADALGHAAELDVLAFDFRGHGRSPGKRGLVRNYSELEGDLLGALAWVERTRPGLPRFVLGHSNGGLVALRVLLAHGADLTGLILSNPALKVAGPVPGLKRAAGAALRRLAPGVTISTGLGSERMTRDPEMLTERRLDSLRHTRICAEIYYAMVEGGPVVAERGGQITTPTLLLLSGADPVIDSTESRRLFERLGSGDKTLRVYPGMLHECLNEMGREQVLADVADWLTGRLAPAVQPAGPAERIR